MECMFGRQETDTKGNGKIVKRMDMEQMYLQMEIHTQETISMVFLIVNILGKPNGHGKYRWKNDSEYKGEFKNGLKHGKGLW
jgi:hypothetical protein